MPKFRRKPRIKLQTVKARKEPLNKQFYYCICAAFSYRKRLDYGKDELGIDYRKLQDDTYLKHLLFQSPTVGCNPIRMTKNVLLRI